MRIDVKLGLDLGGDSLKIAYAYENSYGEICCGKLARSYFEDTFPSSAYYDENTKKWIFGEAIYAGLEKTYRTIVKIKDLFNLLRTEKDSEYFYQFKEFRIFRFPERNKQFETFADAINAGETFRSVNTPCEVCTMFFKHVADYYIRPSMKRLQEVIFAKESNEKKTEIEIFYELVNVYPVKCGGVYIHEMRKIFAEMAKKWLPDTVSEGRAVSVSKAVGLYAYHEKKFENKSAALVVDVGENSVTLLKIKADGAAVQAEGEDGHDVLFSIGGRDYDETLAKVVREKSNTRMMLGESRKASHKNREDEGTSLQQFCLSMRVKNAKTRLSTAQSDDYIVRVEFESDVSVQVPVSKREFLDGVEQESGASDVSQRIADGIVKELSHTDNRSVTHVILSGGASVTSGLKDTVKNAIALKFKNKTVVDFENKTRVVPTDEFTLLNEKGIFAPALGAATLATGKYKIVTVAALSYGTWVRSSEAIVDNVAQKKLRILLKKGTEIPPDGHEYSINLATGQRTDVIENDEIFSTPSVEEFLVGEPGSELRRTAMREKKLKVISGKNGGGRIRFSRIVNDNYVFTEGIIVDRDGKVTPYAGKTEATKGDGIRVWIEGLDSFTVTTEDKEKTGK